MVVERTQAWELLHQPEYCGRLDMDGLYRLMLRAGYSAEVSQRAANQRGWERLSDGLVV